MTTPARDLWQLAGAVESIKTTIDNDLQALAVRDDETFQLGDVIREKDEVAYRAIGSLCDAVAQLARELGNLQRQS